ncbi:MAG: YggT family protein [Chloroflexi bacterium]|nr:YggT family protein [Chloroflexota bacterium]
MTGLLIWLIDLVADGLILVVIVDVILSYVLRPWHPWRRALDRIVEPLLRPIRRVLPPVAGLDFSPLVLILLIGLVRQFLIRILMWL